MVSIGRIFALLFPAVAACASLPYAPRPAPAWTAETRTVLSGEAAFAVARQCTRVSPGPIDAVWTPTDADIAAIENEVFRRLADELDASGSQQSADHYFRQYAGLVIGGRRLIYINGIASYLINRISVPERRLDWRSSAHVMCGAGGFGVEYDLSTRELSNFAFNSIDE